MRPFTAISIIVLAAIALVHLCRAIFGGTLIVGNLTIPVWSSWPVALLFGLLSFTLWGETRR